MDAGSLRPRSSGRRPDATAPGRVMAALPLLWGLAGCMVQDHTARRPGRPDDRIVRSGTTPSDPALRRISGTTSDPLPPMPDPSPAAGPAGSPTAQPVAAAARPVGSAEPVAARSMAPAAVGSAGAVPARSVSAVVGSAEPVAAQSVAAVVAVVGSAEPVAPSRAAAEPYAPPAQPAAPPFDPLRLAGLATDPAAATPPSIPQVTPPQPIDLPAALRLADRQNPAIGEARILILAALANRQAAYALLLPTLNTGTNYHDHVGVLQRPSGTILPVTEQSLYVGAGASTLGSSTVNIPGVNIFSPLADAIFEPLAAQQRVRGSQANAANSARTVLLDVARLYWRLLGAQAAFEARRVTARDADAVAASVATFAATGQGRRSDAERADATRRLLQIQILRAEELMAVTSAQLAERLNLDPSGRLQPTNVALEPVELIDPGTPVESLMQAAIARRPDLETRRALVTEANFQVHREKARPFLPTVWVSFSGGAFGGGSNLVPPTFRELGGRTDFDARAYWTVLNFGMGNVALIRQRQAQAGQAVADQVRLINEIRLQVAAARARSLALKDRVAVAQARLRSADDGFAQDQARLRETLARPIEALDSLALLSEARIALIEAITDFNVNQFELFVALGTPPPG